MEVKPGDNVTVGQVIAYVGDQPGGDMLHLELFSDTASGDLTTDRNNPANAPYYRRSDLMDPTPILDCTLGTAIGKQVTKYEYETDAEGRKFLKT